MVIFRWNWSERHEWFSKQTGRENARQFTGFLLLRSLWCVSNASDSWVDGLVLSANYQINLWIYECGASYAYNINTKPVWSLRDDSWLADLPGKLGSFRRGLSSIQRSKAGSSSSVSDFIPVCFCISYLFDRGPNCGSVVHINSRVRSSPIPGMISIRFSRLDSI